LKVSIITVAYNSAERIVDTLNTVAMQTHTEIEHLIIDGASNDGTVEIVLSRTSKAIRLLSERDKGIYDAMNKGLAHATGEVVGFLNSDDFYVDSEVLAKITNVFKDPAVEACYADLVYVTQDNSRVVRYWGSKPFSKGDFAKGWCPAHPTFYVRKAVIERLGNFDLSHKLAADVEFMMRYLELGNVRVVYIPHILVRMRIGGATNKSWKNIALQNKEIFAAMRKNGISFSIIWFTANKIASRIWQFAAGRVRRNN
jgi:glycosyltransferase involved in cell wall biosynthesis